MLDVCSLRATPHTDPMDSPIVQKALADRGLDIHEDALTAGQQVVIVDDLLATGGTARALCDLVADRGGQVVGCAFLVELTFLRGRERLAPFEVHTLVGFDAE